MIRQVYALIFVVSLALTESQGQGPAYYASKQASLKPILEVLDHAGVSGSLEFSGSCNSFSGPDFPEFPTFRASVTTRGSALQTVREMFADDPNMTVTQDPDGTIRMVQRGVPTDFLDVKIAHISFETGKPPVHRPIYNANAALAHIFATLEVKRFMKNRDIDGPFFGVVTGALPPSAPAPLVPHISGLPLDDVTVSQAMDYILKGFPGIWFFEDCPRRDKRNRIVNLGFYHLQELGGTVQ